MRIKTTLAAITITATMATIAHADEAWNAKYMTFGSPNCRWYNELNEDNRLVYVFGLMDGAGNELKLTYGEIQKGITAVCAVTENIRIPIGSAYTIFAAKVYGKSEQEIAYLSAQYRQEAIWGPKAEPEPSKKEPTSGKL